jgi:hypothetical protein
MALWSTTDANTSAPKFNVGGGLGIAVDGDTLFNNVTTSAYVSGEKIGIFGISDSEMAGVGNLTTITVTNPGAGFNVRPTIVISGANTTQATANANAIVVSASVNTDGKSYANGDILTIAGGTGSAANLIVTNVNANGNVIAVGVDYPGNYTALPNLVNALISANTSVAGGGFTANVVYGLGDVTVGTVGRGYTTPTFAIAGYGPTGNVAATVVANLSGLEGNNRGAHTGWNLRREGSAGRAGRITYETLVACGITTDSATDDDVLAP